MLFNSYGFVFLFLPLCIGGCFLCRTVGEKQDRDRRTKLFLLVMSFAFYGIGVPGSLPVLVISMAVNYGIYLLMEKTSQKKAVFICGICLNLGALIFFKYTGFSYVPLGISFFTFTQIAFLTECFKGSLQGVKALDYGVYAAFFPKLAEGPIALPGEILPQLSGKDVIKPAGEKEESGRDFSERLFRGLCLFVLGLSKKVLIADTLGKAVDFGYANLSALNAGDALIVMLSYTLQLYFDFSGYCDMAMGIGRCLSVELPLNFDSPYKAGNIIEFWKGWHITLTRFFTRYLYIPLGGNRKGKLQTYGNILLIFLVSGIWHGKGWQFIVWGMMHGVLYVITRWRQEKKGKERGEQSRIKRILCTAATFLYVNAAWVFFRAPSVKEALTLLKTIAGCRFARLNWNLAGCFNMDEFWYVIKLLRIDRWQYAHYILMFLALLFALILVFFARTAVQVAEKMKPRLTTSVILAVLFVWCILTFSEVSTFLYFNF